MNKLLLFLFLLVAAGCARTPSENFDTPAQTTTGYSPGSDRGKDPIQDGEKAQATFSGGDGSSMKEAIVISNAPNETTGIRAEYIWLHEHYPGYTLQRQTLRSDQAGNYDEMQILTSDGKTLTVYFDISSYLGKY